MERIFNDFIRYAQDQRLCMEGIAIADGQRVLMQHRFTPDLPRNIYSHTKSYTATAVGMAVSEGRLSLDDRLVDFFPEHLPADAPAALGDIALRHLLTMSSGFGHAYLMTDDRRAGVGMPDYIGYLLSRPVKRRPGEAFCYSNGDTYLAGCMAEKALGTNLRLFLYERLFSRMDQGMPVWECDPQGRAFGASGLQMRLTDMLKLGQLYLNGGKWQGERLLDAAWTREAGKKQIDTPAGASPDPWRCGYGYQFWCLPFPGSFRADGAYGQISAVLPEKGLVVAVQCPESGNFERVKRALHERVLLAL